MSKLFGSSPSAVKMSLRKVTHVIFDMDGLLLDTERLYTEATQNVFDQFGLTYTWEVKATLMGLQREEVAKRITEVYNLPITWEEYMEQAHEECVRLMRDSPLLPDTEHVYEKMIADIAKAYGKPYPLEVRMKVLGTTEHRTAEIAVQELKLPISVSEFKLKFSELGRHRLGDVSILRGAEKLIRHLHANKVPICLATSSGSDMVEIKTQNHKELFALLDHQVCGSTDPEVKVGKPAPDIFLVAAQRFPDSPKPENCLVFEDAPNGVTAARAAGMQAVMVPDKNVPAEQRAHATVVLESLEDIRLEDFGLPPFSK